LIVLDGAKAGLTAVGLDLNASNSTVKGLAINDFAGGGVLVSGASGDLISKDYIGVTAAGNIARGNGYGVTLQNGADKNTVSLDVISGNKAQGVLITVGANQNQVEGNLIGTSAGGTAALGNGAAGVAIWWSSDGNVIGGNATGAGNLISGNAGDGINLQQRSDGNFVEANVIGTNQGRTIRLGNGGDGVGLGTGSDNNVIGGTPAGVGNVISANGRNGVYFSDATGGNVVEGNLIGTNAAGATTLGNSANGVMIFSGPYNNTVGGTAAGAANVISDNWLGGVELNTAGFGNLIEDDVIKSNGFGKQTVPYGDGVYIYNTLYTSVIGCTIDFNRDWGILQVKCAYTTIRGDTLVGNGLGPKSP
jgi:hypothetical protein